MHIVNEGELLKKRSKRGFLSLFMFFSRWLKDKSEKELNNNQTFLDAR